MAQDKQQREFELVVYGAASFVGKILCHYLNLRHGVGGDLRWAIAGRDAAKLASLKAELNAPDLPHILADAKHPQALKQMVERAQVVVSTVGPYALYGSPLIAACVAAGTDYCDLTGEVQWVREMIDSHAAQAAQSGARIVHCCGFDSIPSDLGVWFTQQQAQDQFGAPCQQIKMRVKAARGGMSGGTVASLLNVVKQAGKNPALRRELQNPYSITPLDQRIGPRQPNVTIPVFDAEANSWLAPFIMAGINTRVVHRSHALQGRPWGEDFSYDEAMMMGRGAAGRMRAWGLSGGMGGFMALAALPPSRLLLEKFVLPKPGEGPSPKEQENGFYDLRFYGRTAAGDQLVTKLTGDRDPGYGSTAKMLGEAAVCLARDPEPAKLAGGFWTPATALGGSLLQRLEAHAGLSFERL